MRSDIFSGRYFFHFHTNLTDGALTVHDYFEFAESKRIERLVFLEHIRRQPTYDVGKFAADVAAATAECGVATTLGFEAKLLPGGSLDITEADLMRAGVIGIAEHGYPRDEVDLRRAFLRAVVTYPDKYPRIQFVWVHPGLSFMKRGLSPFEQASYREMREGANRSRVLLEKNLRYGLVDEAELTSLDQYKVVLGADAHSRRDLEAYLQLQ